MTLEPNEQLESGLSESRTPWVKPELKRLEAGAAENALAGANDFAMNPS